MRNRPKHLLPAAEALRFSDKRPLIMGYAVLCAAIYELLFRPPSTLFPASLLAPPEAPLHTRPGTIRPVLQMCIRDSSSGVTYRITPSLSFPSYQKENIFTDPESKVGKGPFGLPKLRKNADASLFWPTGASDVLRRDGGWVPSPLAQQ